ncbi:MAG: prepilin-type N-terminal cleavage/methylation domain-containing protein [Elusimicrobia bacterium]|nr:prepilin-type N-terminal cleavage/methylation domain-containing protein [Elusimicrobiota bacterium]
MYSKKFSKRAGFGLVEAMIAIFLLAMMSLSIVYMYQYVSFAHVKTLENSYTTRLSEMVFSKLKTVEYYYLFDYDSAKPNYGLSGTYGPVTLQRSTYPYTGTLNEINAILANYKIAMWQVSIKFKIRDISDVDGDGIISDLRDFADSNSDLIDDYDANVKYYKANGDADYYDTYASTSLNKPVSEFPDTNLKEVELKLYKNGRTIHTQKELISLEMLSGIESKASGAELELYVNQPANDTYLYDLMTSPRQDAFNIVLSTAYPPEVIAYRADSIAPLRLWGETVPLATVRFYINSMGGSPKDTRTADALGNFDFQSALVTQNLLEGENMIYAQAVKDTYYSPYAPRRVLLDLNPPAISVQTPTGSTGDLMPYAGAVITDAVLSTGIPSGICEQTITMRVNGSSATYKYSAATGDIYWYDPDTGAPPLLSNGNSYTVYLELGDNAYYKAQSTWTFTVSVNDPDNSAPSTANKVPSGATSEPMPEISCRVFDNQSGIDLYSITMKVDETVVVSSANITSHFDFKTGKAYYTPETPFLNGSYHAIEVSVSHWADTPADKKTSVDSWGFTVSY